MNKSFKFLITSYYSNAISGQVIDFGFWLSQISITQQRQHKQQCSNGHISALLAILRSLKRPFKGWTGVIMKINNHFKDQTKFFWYGTFHNVPDYYIQSPNENNSFNDNQWAVVPCYNPTPHPPKSNNFFMFFTFL